MTSDRNTVFLDLTTYTWHGGIAIDILFLNLAYSYLRPSEFAMYAMISRGSAQPSLISYSRTLPNAGHAIHYQTDSTEAHMHISLQYPEIQKLKTLAPRHYSQTNSQARHPPSSHHHQHRSSPSTYLSPHRQQPAM